MSLANVFTTIGIIASLIAIIGGLVALTRYFASLEAKSKATESALAFSSLERKLEAAEARNEHLAETIELAGKSGQAAIGMKRQMDELLNRTMASCNASGGSIYVPIEKGDVVQGLSFLTIEPFNRQNRLLKSKIIPMRSMAGRCYQSGEAILISQVDQSTERFKSAENITDYHPASSINYPLSHRGEMIGVLQLLRQEGEISFSKADFDLVKAHEVEISSIVDELRQFPEIQGAMRETGVREGIDASILFFDISSSSTLFREFSTGFALQLLNEFFEETCEIGFQHGGALDNYMGDGALMRFAPPRIAVDHELRAAEAAISMLKAFPTVRHYWCELNPSLAKVQFRAGIASGPLLEGVVGHSLVRSLGIAGLPITVASALCNAIPRDRSAVYVDPAMAQRLGNSAKLREIAVDKEGKLGVNTEKAFELLEINS
ncbi:MAG: GAF domain-containing protein [Alteraurantiacibacter sp.]